MRAVQLKDHEAVWFDKRRPISTLNFSVIKGFILNVPSDYKFGGIISLPWERKHWYFIFLNNFNQSYLELSICIYVSKDRCNKSK
jgi:josephin